jgi:hypothetical protein
MLKFRSDSCLSKQNKYRLIHGHCHIGLIIIPRHPYWPETKSRANMGRGMITRPIWKCPCIKLFITYFRHLEKRHHIGPRRSRDPYWPGPIWASIWKWSCSNPITGYFPGVWKYGQFTSGHIGHTKMPLFSFSLIYLYIFGWFMVFNATFNNISVMSWRSALLVEETGIRGENHRPVASYWQSLSHNVVSSTLRHERDSNSQN